MVKRFDHEGYPLSDDESGAVFVSLEDYQAARDEIEQLRADISEYKAVLAWVEANDKEQAAEIERLREIETAAAAVVSHFGDSNPQIEKLRQALQTTCNRPTPFEVSDKILRRCVAKGLVKLTRQEMEELDTVHGLHVFANNEHAECLNAIRPESKGYSDE